MLVIRIELWPKGNESKKIELGRATIINDCTGDDDASNYDVSFFTSPARLPRRVRLTGVKMRGVWEILHNALQKSFSSGGA